MIGQMDSKIDEDMARDEQSQRKSPIPHNISVFIQRPIVFGTFEYGQFENAGIDERCGEEGTGEKVN
jgi:hypothetical protein